MLENMVVFVPAWSIFCWPGHSFQGHEFFVVITCKILLLKELAVSFLSANGCRNFNLVRPALTEFYYIFECYGKKGKYMAI